MPVKLQPVPLDLVAGASGELSNQVAHGALVQVLYAAAARAHQVVMVAAAGEPVVQAAILQQDAADNPHVGEKTHSPEDGGPTGTTRAPEEVVHGEVVPLLQHRRYDG